MPKAKAYLKRMKEAAILVDARTELSVQALDALSKPIDRMDARVFQELCAKGYLLAQKRSWTFSQKAIAYQAACRSDAK